jgi:hypothetical protein
MNDIADRLNDTHQNARALRWLVTCMIAGVGMLGGFVAYFLPSLVAAMFMHFTDNGMSLELNFALHLLMVPLSLVGTIVAYRSRSARRNQWLAFAGGLSFGVLLPWLLIMIGIIYISM